VAQKSAPVQVRSATLAQQKMCDEQAHKKFLEDNGNEDANHTTTEYTSHFDSRANVCYMMVHRASVEKDVPVVSDVVYDAFEGRVYGNLTWINSQGKKFWEVAPVECNVKPRGHAAITCKSFEEFERLVDKHFGIGR
jgi:hypothetical protein